MRLFIPVKLLYDEVFNDKGGFYTMDVVADYLAGNNLHVFVKVINLFNERYGGLPYSVMSTPLPFNPQSGRFAQFGLTYTFN
jgi:outer membrane receptor protein involved in Fe transport